MTMKIDVYTDLACPWCLIGVHRLDRVIASRFAGEAFDIEHHPVFLMPDLPISGVRLDDYVRDKFGLSDPAQAWARPEAEARAYGIAFDHRRVPIAYPTDRAHTLIRLARPLGTQHGLAVALTDAYLLEGVNIADPGILAGIATRFGFDQSEAEQCVQDPVELNRTHAAARASAAKGVRTIPHFVFGDRDHANGNLSDEAIGDAILAIRQTHP